MVSLPPTELVLLVFLHGFKGGADTFDAFPDRIAYLLSQTHATVDFAAVVYPPYDTRGELSAAVDTHLKWLTELVAERRVAHEAKGGTGQVRVILIGHSMGGLVIADTLRAILATPTPTSPAILGLIAYDTPYWGLNPAVFKSTAEKYLGYAQTGHAVLTGLGVGAGIWGAAWGANKADGPVPPTASPPAGYTDAKRKETASTSTITTATPATAAGSSWFKVAGAAAALAGVAAGAAYYGKDAVNYGREAVTSSTAALAGHLDWAKSHLSFVGELWATDALESRLEAIERATGDGVGFHCFYTLLPKTAACPSTTRTFIVLPRSGPVAALFSPNTNGRAADEIAAHVEMFTADSDGQYALGSETCALISGWIDGTKDAKGKDAKGKMAEDNPWA